MSIAEAIEQTRRLTPAQRRELAEILISEAEASDDLSPQMMAELDRRAEEALRTPDRCRPWAAMKSVRWFTPAATILRR